MPDALPVRSVNARLIAFAAAAAIGFSGCADKQSGHSEGSNIFAAANGEHTLVLIDRVSAGQRYSKFRTTAIDPATGRSVSQFFPHLGGCVAASPGKIWCEFWSELPNGAYGRRPVDFAHSPDDGLLLLDRATLSPLLKFDDAVDKANLGKRVFGRLTIDKGIAYSLLDNGSAARVDPATLEVKSTDELPNLLTRGYLETFGATAFHALGTNFQCKGSSQIPPRNEPVFSFTDGMRAAVVHTDDPHANDYGPITPGEAPATRQTGSAKFLAPKFVFDSVTGDPLMIDGDPIIVHADALAEDPKLLHESLSRIGKDGSAVWTVALGGACERISAADGVVFVSTPNEAQRALGIDAKTGNVRWHVAF